jgi:hypothetical protein
MSRLAVIVIAFALSGCASFMELLDREANERYRQERSTYPEGTEITCVVEGGHCRYYTSEYVTVWLAAAREAEKTGSLQIKFAGR